MSIKNQVQENKAEVGDGGKSFGVGSGGGSPVAKGGSGSAPMFEKGDAPNFGGGRIGGVAYKSQVAGSSPSF